MILIPMISDFTFIFPSTYSINFWIIRNIVRILRIFELAEFSVDENLLLSYEKMKISYFLMKRFVDSFKDNHVHLQTIIFPRVTTH
jgi:hypothetical protein